VVCGHTSVNCLILPLFPCICYSVVEHTLYHVSLCIVLLLILSMLIWCVLLSNVYRVCICYLLLLVILMSHDIWFVMSGLVLLLLDFQFLHSDLPSTATWSVFFTIKLSTHTYNILTMHYLLSHFFKESSNLAYMCWVPSFLCHCSHLV
jgi:hypothetical protein